MTSIIQTLKSRWELIILALMLELLHLSIWIDFASPVSRSLMLVHLGLFLIWQPVWRSDEHLSWQNSVIFIILTLAFVTFMSWWLIFGWLILLTGFAGGRVIINHQERNTYMIVLIFLTSELIIECTTQLFNIQILSNIRELFGICLPLLPLLITVLPQSNDENRVTSVDILHALATSTLILVLTFGGLLNMYLGGVEYLISILQSLTAIALFLFAISWMLSPRLGFSGLSQLWSRALLNIGTPFEQWLTRFSNLAQQQQTAEEFLEATMDELVTLPWIAGVQWAAQGSKGQIAVFTGHETKFIYDDLTVCIYTNNWMGGALYIHCSLLIQLIENLYVAKIRERKLTQQAHLQAIYETGARVTHDIKNLLQSLQAITSIIIHEKDNSIDKTVSQQLLEKQLPHLTQRLQLALDKLQTPQQTSTEKIYLKDWWQDLQQRTNLANIEYHADFTGDPIVPVDLFDSVVENLLENLREKAQVESNLCITISLYGYEENTQLLISDNGNKIPDDKANIILKEPVNSDNGLGIGLYQAARQAESFGYLLTLKSNQEGNVCFELTNNANAHLIESKKSSMIN